MKMKKVMILVMVVSTILFTGCFSYKSFISVTPAIDVANGSTEIIARGCLNDVKTVLKKNLIMYKEYEGGIETEEILIDEGTRAKYKIYQYDDMIKMISFWGITQAVKSQIIVFAGYSAASAYSTEGYTRVIYDRDVKRPARVFSYGYQLMKEIDPKLRVK
jgi:hypothetical protein